MARNELAFCYVKEFSIAFEHLMFSISIEGVEKLCLNFHSQNSAVMFEFSFKLLSSIVVETFISGQLHCATKFQIQLPPDSCLGQCFLEKRNDSRVFYS